MSDRLTAKVSILSLLAVPSLAISAAVLLLAPTGVSAHGVSVFAHSEGDTIVVEGSFHDGAKCTDCAVEAFDSLGRKIAEGKTDADGVYSFKTPARTDILIRLSDPMGHLAEYRVPASDLPESPSPDETETGDEHPHAHAYSGPAEDASADSRDERIHDSAEVERVIEKVVARQLAPIRRALEESQRRRRFSDVVGGIGYIVGLLGLILYFRSRRPQ